VFEESGSIKYMKIPIADHWKENLASFFPKAIEFIGKLHNTVFIFILFSALDMLFKGFH
jgi:hypothetical protein